MGANRFSGTLFFRLVAVLLVLLVAVGAVTVWRTVVTAEQYFNEVNQNLNLGVAQGIAKKLQMDLGLDPADLTSGEQSLAERKEQMQPVFGYGMSINPSVEIYLLDREGRILAYDAPDEVVKLEHVPLAPVEAFLDRAAPMLGEIAAMEPVTASLDLMEGPNPRHPGRSNPFSAAPLGDPAAPDGYVYVVLGGDQHAAIAARKGESVILRAGTWVVLGCLAVALLLGLAAFGLLTRPIRRLRTAMDDFQNDDLESRVELSSNDELGAVGETFNAMADRILEQMDGIRERDRLRRELMANISHDLRTPVAVLHGFLETALQRDSSMSPEQRREFLRSGLRNTERLSRLVDDLFELAKFDAGEVRLRRETFDLRELVVDVRQKFEPRAEERGIRLITRIPDQLPQVRADIGLIERVIDNLVENALRYTLEGGKVAISLTENGHAVEVRVTDTGVGIPEEELPRIFDRFYRVEKSRSDDSGGTGLGLAITKRILDLHESRIQVRSQVDVGTVFTFTLAA